MMSPSPGAFSLKRSFGACEKIRCLLPTLLLPHAPQLEMLWTFLMELVMERARHGSINSYFSLENKF
jgi:hypothetical protein